MKLLVRFMAGLSVACLLRYFSTLYPDWSFSFGWVAACLMIVASGQWAGLFEVKLGGEE